MKDTQPHLLPLSLLILFALAGAAWAQNAGEVPDPSRLLNDITMANAMKDVGRIDELTKGITTFAKAAKERDPCDALAKELSDSIKVCKGNWGTLGKIVDTLGELRSKYGAKALKRLATQKKNETADGQALQAKALVALGMTADSRNINTLADMTKHRNNTVAKGAYESFKHYGTAKGKTRKKVAEVLMKRLEMEYPSSGGQGGKTVSAEAQERWSQLGGVIIASLQAVCRETTLNDVANWREWWKENKRDRRAWQDD